MAGTVPTKFKVPCVQAMNEYAVLSRNLNKQCGSILAYTRSDSKVMRLVPKKNFLLLIHQVKCGHLQSTSLVPAHTFYSAAGILYSIPGTHFVGCSLRPALQTSGCFLLTQNGVLSLSTLLFEIKISRKVRDQVTKEAAASP